MADLAAGSSQIAVLSIARVASPARRAQPDFTRMMSIQHGRPHDSHNSLIETFEALPESVAPVRGRVAAFAAQAGATPVQVDAVRLAVSEAITNAVVHAYRPGPGSVTVHVSIADAELWILVSDDGVGLEPRADRPGLGLGLGLIAQLSDDFAIVARSSGGTEVRIRFDLDPARHRDDRSGEQPGGSPGVDAGPVRRSDLTASVLAASAVAA